MTDKHHGLTSEGRLQRAGEVLGAQVLAGAEVTTAAFQRSQRVHLAGRVIVFALGFALAVTVGVGWALLSLGAVIHHLVFRSRQALVATDAGLFLITSGPRSLHVVREWHGAIEATLTLQPGSPDVVVGIGDWDGRTDGLELDAIESAVRAAGGEPLRIVSNP